MKTVQIFSSFPNKLKQTIKIFKKVEMGECSSLLLCEKNLIKINILSMAHTIDVLRPYDYIVQILVFRIKSTQKKKCFSFFVL